MPAASAQTPGPEGPQAACVACISAVTLATADMARAVRFYQALGLRRLYGGPEAAFTSFAVGPGYLNLAASRGGGGGSTGSWGRVIFHVTDVDAFYERVRRAGLSPQFPPRDAEWGERYFHLRDPDGHELSFAQPLPRRGGPAEAAPASR